MAAGLTRIFGFLALLFATGNAVAQCQWTSGTTSITQACGSVGIGTTTPAAALDVLGWPGIPANIMGAALNAGGDMYFGNTGASVARGRLGSNANQGFLHWNLFYNGSGYRSMNHNRPSYELDINGIADSLTFRRYVSGADNAITAAVALMTIAGSGNVGIGITAPTARLHVGGDAVFTGTVRGANIQAHFQDVAEWVPSTSDLEPGTVVVLNRTRTNEVTISNAAYATTVAGVVSAQPGVILGEAAPGREQIATTGRVKVKADARTGAIAIGDLLVSSDVPGKAMRSVGVTIDGREFHQPGTIIGKALEPLTAGEGEILVLLSLQ